MSNRDTSPTVTPWVEREFPDTLDIIRWDAGFAMDAGYHWDQLLGVAWGERNFGSAASSRSYPVWSRR